MALVTPGLSLATVYYEFVTGPNAGERHSETYPYADRNLAELFSNDMKGRYIRTTLGNKKIVHVTVEPAPVE